MRIPVRLRAVTATVALATAAFLVSPVLAAPAGAETAPVTYRDFVYPTTANSAPSQDKPQSKLWYQDGAWWSLLATPSGSGVDIFELTGHVWRDTGVLVDNRATSTADALWEGGKLYVASRTSSGALRLYRLSYLAATRSYAMDSGFPVQIATGGSESITVARDAAGRLWTTWTQASKVWMSFSTTSDTAWSGPVLVPVSDVSVSADDISAVVATGSTVGIMWSDQASTAFRFAVHSASSAPTADWTMQTPLSGTRLADDHLNLKSLLADDNGRIHAVIKTSLGDASTDLPTDPSLIVLSRSSDGSWTKATVTTVADKLTRPQLLLDSSNKDLYVLMSTEGGGTGYYKKAPLSNISFAPGKGTVFMAAAGSAINDLSTTKDPVSNTTGIVAIGSASNTRTYFHTEMALGAAAPPPPPPPASTPGFHGASSGANTAGTTVTATRPAGTVPGDAVVAAVSVRSVPTVTAPPGWSLVRRDVNGTTSATSVFVHNASATDPASWTFTLGSAHTAAVALVSYGGVSAVTPVGASGGAVAASGTTVTAPSVSAPAAGSVVVGFFSMANATTIDPPAGMTERAESSTPANAFKTTIEASDYAAPAAGATGAKTATGAKSTANIGQLVALVPAA